MSSNTHTPTQEICFGLSRSNDEKSFIAFMQCFSGEELLDALAPRLSSQEIEETVSHLSALMRRHLKGQEYHAFFLRD